MKRKQRIATGSGTSVQDVNKIVKQLKQMQTMMKKMRKMGAGKMMGMMKDMMGGKAGDFELMSQAMDPESLGKDMAGLGPNPFEGSAGMPGLGGPALPGLGADPLASLPTHGGKKKNRKKKKR
jgi:signal recognition particle subunit SRP54